MELNRGRLWIFLRKRAVWKKYLICFPHTFLRDNDDLNDDHDCIVLREFSSCAVRPALFPLPLVEVVCRFDWLMVENRPF